MSSHYTRTTSCGYAGSRIASHAIFVALRIIAKYPRRDPKPRELMDDFGMSRATAYRWLVAIRDARCAMATDQGGNRNAA